MTNERKKKEKGGTMLYRLLALIVLNNTCWGEHKRTTGIDALWSLHCDSTIPVGGTMKQKTKGIDAIHMHASCQ